jgi:predicted O-methyltransferase YrrM
MKELSSEGTKLNLTGVESSYRDSNYGSLFYSLTCINKPKLVVELGTYQGYSGLHIANALVQNRNVSSEFYMIDLWEDYPYRKCSLQTTKNNFASNGLLSLKQPSCYFLQRDAVEAHTKFKNGSIDLLHIDLSNDGDSLQRCLERWHCKLNSDATLIMEGGSKARDEIVWMQKNEKKPIRSFLNSDWFVSRYMSITLGPFPSITIARKLN